MLAAFLLPPPIARATRTKKGLPLTRTQPRRYRTVPTAVSKGPVELMRDAQQVYGAEKPPWCQPWTIVSTGGAAIAGSWATLRGWGVLLALLVTAGVAVWWLLFLVVYPQQALEE